MLRRLLIVLVLLMAPLSAAQAQGQPHIDPNIQHQEFSVGQAQEFFSDEFGDPLTSIFLHELFGPLFPAVDRGPDAVNRTVFSTIIGYFNVVALGLGGLLFAWNATAGLLQTAHEGELLGRRWSSLWAPMRVVFAVGMLVPLPNLEGYNAVQAGVAYVVRGATMTASFLWTKSAEALLADQIPLSAQPPSIPGSMVEKMYSIAACREVVTRQFLNNKGYLDSGYRIRSIQVEARESGSRVRDVVSLRLYFPNGQSSPLCGYWSTPVYDEDIVSYLEKSGIKDEDIDFIFRNFKDAHFAIMQNLYNRMWSIAHEKADVVLTEKASRPLSSRGVSHSPGIADAVIQANTDLSRLFRTIFSAVGVLKGEDGAMNGELLLNAITGGEACRSEVMADKENRHRCYGEGWIGAGKWYIAFARINNSLNVFSSVFGKISEDIVFNRVKPPAALGYKPHNWTVDETESAVGVDVTMALQNSGTPVYGTDHAIKLLDVKKASAGYAAMLQAFHRDKHNLGAFGSGFEFNPAVLELSTSDGWGLSNWIQKTAVGKYVRSMMDDLLNWRFGDDPLLAMMSFGEDFLHVAAGLLAVVAVTQALPMGVGDGIGSAAQSMFGVFWGTGALLQIILPMMPWILWVVGVTGYFLLVVEAVVGVSLWAFAHLRLDGEGISGAATNGWTLLLALLLTPILMVFGFVIGMGIFRVTSGLLLSGIFPVFQASVVGSSLIAIMLILPALGLLVGVMQLILIERSFSLVTEFPNRVLNWIGARADLADQGALDRARIGMIGATAATGSAGAPLARGIGGEIGSSVARLTGRSQGRIGQGRGDDRPTGQ